MQTQNVLLGFVRWRPPQPLAWPWRRWGRRRSCCFRPVSGAAVEPLGGILVSSALRSCILGFPLHFSSKQSPKGAHHAQQRNGPGAPEAGSLLPVVALFSIYPPKDSSVHLFDPSAITPAGALFRVTVPVLLALQQDTEVPREPTAPLPDAGSHVTKFNCQPVRRGWRGAGVTTTGS